MKRVRNSAKWQNRESFFQYKYSKQFTILVKFLVEHFYSIRSLAKVTNCNCIASSLVMGLVLYQIQSEMAEKWRYVELTNFLIWFLYSAIIAAFSGGLGLLTGGFIISKFKFGKRKMALQLTISTLTTLIGVALLIAMNCPTLHVDGSTERWVLRSLARTRFWRWKKDRIMIFVFSDSSGFSQRFHFNKF